MTVASGQIKITGRNGRRNEEYITKAALPVFGSEIESMIKKHLPNAQEGTVTSDISSFDYTVRNDQILFTKSRGE